MLATAGLLLITLILILISAELFTNALEHVGERLNLSEGVTGSIFAAIGTALPETIVPILAVMAGTDDVHANQEISTGAILGAPLMLSTLTMSLIACASVLRRGIKGRITPEITGLRRDLHFFLFAYSIATITMFLPNSLPLRIGISIVLVSTYILYLMRTLQASQQLVDDGHATQAHSELCFTRFGLADNRLTIAMQLIASLALLIASAQGFIHGIRDASSFLGLSPLILSMMVMPIATELPEKLNSILWIRKDKDTLAVGNVTGAMVFQGTLLPALGILMTPWLPNATTIPCLIVTLAAALWLRVISNPNGFPIIALAINGITYVCYITYLLMHNSSSL